MGPHQTIEERPGGARISVPLVPPPRPAQAVPMEVLPVELFASCAASCPCLGDILFHWRLLLLALFGAGERRATEWVAALVLQMDALANNSAHRARSRLQNRAGGARRGLLQVPGAQLQVEEQV